MIALRQNMTVPKDHILRLDVPNVPKGEEVEVLVLSKKNSDYTAKIALMAEAANDPLFRNDMNEIASDFAFVDFEHL